MFVSGTVVAGQVTQLGRRGGRYFRAQAIVGLFCCEIDIIKPGANAGPGHVGGPGYRIPAVVMTQPVADQGLGGLTGARRAERGEIAQPGKSVKLGHGAAAFQVGGKRIGAQGAFARGQHHLAVQDAGAAHRVTGQGIGGNGVNLGRPVAAQHPVVDVAAVKHVAGELEYHPPMNSTERSARRYAAGRPRKTRPCRRFPPPWTAGCAASPPPTPSRA